MATNQAEELERYPKYKQAYLRAFEEMLEARRAAGKNTEWQTAEDVIKWWVQK